ncbi:MAG: methionine--tRNA ligase [Bacteroidota bacterium]
MTRYFTTPIYYPNDRPHIGTAYPTLAADIAARWARLCGDEAFVLTGTDEHGKKIEKAARKAGLSPKPFVDQLAGDFKETFQTLGIAYDRFIRTTDADHVRVVQAILQRVYDRGDIYPGTYEGWYCVECEGYYSEEELDHGCCPVHGKPAEWLEEVCYYFRLSRYRDWLLDLYTQRPEFIQPETRRNEVVSFVQGRLEDLCISRSTFEWGIPLPFAEGHITYVWFDALLNYLTGAGYLADGEVFEQRWPSAMHIIGKDILRFHAVIWPAMLHAAGVSPPQRIFAHGFWTVNGRKFSKSLGNAIRPEYLIERYGLEPLRYYLFREFAFGADGDFSEANLVQRNNSELAQGLGNLVRRVTVLTDRLHEGRIPQARREEEPEQGLQRTASAVVAQVRAAMERLDFRGALEATWRLVYRLNVYLNEREPWRLKDEGDLRDAVLAHLVEGLRFLAVLTAPFMPERALEIARRIGLESVPSVASLSWGQSLCGLRVRVGTPLFDMLEPPVKAEPLPVVHTCSEEAQALGIPYCVAQLNNVTIRRQSADVERRKRSIEEALRSKGRSYISEAPEVQGYHALYAHIGKAPGEITSPVDKLSSYIFAQETGRLPQINILVDLYNTHALESFLSIGAHDREKIKGPMRLDIARETTPYRPVGTATTARVQPGEYYWHDDEHVLCRLDIKQSEATKVEMHTRHVVLVVQGNRSHRAETVRQKTKELCEAVVSLCGGSYKILNEARTSLSD